VSTLQTGIIGAGNMGGRMGRCVRDGGDQVVAFDPAQGPECGLPTVGSVAELVAVVDVVLLSLPDSGVVEAVVLGEDGLLVHARAGQIVVDLSTASPESTERIHAALAERGVPFLDAGVSGGAAAAETGTLTLMVGGSGADLERVRPILSHFAARIFHMGSSGSGHVAKALNNFLNGISLAATAEVMVAAKRAGLDLGQLLEVINASSGVNFATLNRFPRIIEGDYLEGGLTGRLMAKDLRLYLEYLNRIGVPSLTGPACLAAFEVVNGMGYGEQISNRVVDGIGDLAGGVRLHDAAVAGGGAAS
jgi:3-hydroxyisobutyrate dehydrogenase